MEIGVDSGVRVERDKPGVSSFRRIVCLSLRAVMKKKIERVEKL